SVEYYFFTRYLPSFPTRRSSDLCISSLFSPSFNVSTEPCVGHCYFHLFSCLQSAHYFVHFEKGTGTLHTACLNLYTIIRDQSVQDQKSTRLNSSHVAISYAVFCL